MSSVVIAEQIPLESAGSVGTGCRVEVVSDYPTLLSLRPAWDELVAQGDVTHPFLSHAWFRNWWDCFGGGRTLHVLLVRAGGKLVAIAPLMQDSVRMYGATLRRIAFMENDHTPRCGIVLARSHEQQAFRAIWSYLHEQERWDVLELNRLPAGSTVIEGIAALAREDRCLTGVRELERSPYVPLQGDWESYLKRLGYNHRRNTRKRFNRLKRCGRVELETITSAAAVQGALDEGLRIEAAAWKEKNGTAMRSDAAVRRFYESYAQHAAQAGTLQLIFLKLDGVRIAFCYALNDYDRLHVLKAGYDPAYSRYSPYNQLCYLVLQDCFARGLAEYDFLGNNEAWKLDWEPQIRPHYGLLVFRRAWHARLLHALKCRVLPLLQRQPLYMRARDLVLQRTRGRRVARANGAESDGDEHD